MIDPGLVENIQTTSQEINIKLNGQVFLESLDQENILSLLLPMMAQRCGLMKIYKLITGVSTVEEEEKLPFSCKKDGIKLRYKCSKTVVVLTASPGTRVLILMI